MKTLIALLFAFGLSSTAFAHVVPSKFDSSYDGLTEAERLIESMESDQ